MSSELIPGLLPALALYPEIHYRFRLFPFSRYYRRQPEILTDAPRRLNPGQALPILLLIKDAHRFPLRLEEVQVEARSDQTVITKQILFGLDFHRVPQNEWWHHIIWVELPNIGPRRWGITVVWQVRIRNRLYRILNDNFPGLSHAPLQVFQSDGDLPRGDNWYFGDLHVHTAYSSDQVEFGAPLTVYPEMALAQGLSFAFPADHAYDLDDLPGSFCQTDPDLQRFHQRNREIQRLNNGYPSQFMLLPGFELSVGNHRRQNVHLLLIGQKDFLPGAGDSAERWWHTKPELNLSTAINRRNNGTLAVAAHPLIQPPALERWLLNRGVWEELDLDVENLGGLQIWNGDFMENIQAGINRWIQGLLAGKRWRLYAGSDAHGNFNRYRQVGFPMWKLIESERHVFGQVYTGVKLPSVWGLPELLAGLQKGTSLVSDGPFADLRIFSEVPTGIVLQAEAKSSPEFGALAEISICYGEPGMTIERRILHLTSGLGYGWNSELNGEEIKIPAASRRGYARMTVQTDQAKFCLTNPIFFNDLPT